MNGDGDWEYLGKISFLRKYVFEMRLIRIWRKVYSYK